MSQIEWWKLKKGIGIKVQIPNDVDKETSKQKYRPAIFITKEKSILSAFSNKETILASKSIINLKKTLLWITIIYYVLMFIFTLHFLIKKIRKR